jgi:hypothetical protein
MQACVAEEHPPPKHTHHPTHLSWEQPVCRQLRQVEVHAAPLAQACVTLQHDCSVIQLPTLCLTHDAASKVGVLLQQPQQQQQQR